MGVSDSKVREIGSKQGGNPLANVRDKVSEAEWQTRVDLAACYRLVAMYGWTDLIYNHISARVPGEDDAYLLNPFGLHYEEITASSLIKIDVKGNILFNPDPRYSVNVAGFVIHGAVHGARHDLTCVIHTHTIPGMVISALKQGWMPLVQTMMKFPKMSYHAFEGLAVDTAECARLVADLGDCDVMVLRNHGLLAGGKTIQQAFNNIYRMERGAEVQMHAMACNAELDVPSPELVAHTAAQYSKNPASGPNSQPMGMLEWPALLRLLDARGSTYAQ